MSVSDSKAAAAAVIDNSSSIEHLPNMSSIFSAELLALFLALDWVQTAFDDNMNFIIVYSPKSALQAIWWKTGYILLPLRCWNVFIGSCSAMRNEYILLASQPCWYQGL